METKTVPSTGPGASQFRGAEEQLGPREPGECPGSHVEEGHRAEGGATAAVRTETMAFLPLFVPSLGRLPSQDTPLYRQAMC